MRDRGTDVRVTGSWAMPWNHQYSPLDHTIDQLERLAAHMRRALETDGPVVAEDFRAAMDVVARLAAELKPLQEAQVQERR